MISTGASVAAAHAEYPATGHMRVVDTEDDEASPVDIPEDEADAGDVADEDSELPPEDFEPLPEGW